MADDLDVITFPDAKTAINANQASFDLDDQLALFVTTVSRRFDELIGPVVSREVTETHDGGCVAIFPRQTPVLSVTSVTEYDGASTALTAETFGTEPADAYLLEQSGSYAHDHRIIRRSGGADFAFTAGRRNVQVVYNAGRAADTDSVDTRISQTAGMVLRRLWKREQGSWAASPDIFEATDSTFTAGFHKTVDMVVREYLADELKPPGIA